MTNAKGVEALAVVLAPLVLDDVLAFPAEDQLDGLVERDLLDAIESVEEARVGHVSGVAIALIQLDPEQGRLSGLSLEQGNEWLHE